jgi:hypothetical protein
MAENEVNAGLATARRIARRQRGKTQQSASAHENVGEIIQWIKSGGVVFV